MFHVARSWYLKLDKFIEQNYDSDHRNLQLNILDLGCGPGTIALQLCQIYTRGGALVPCA